eukprot:m51a1_g10786 hypothetical protein (2117) ;mRNA; f:64893-78880
MRECKGTTGDCSVSIWANQTQHLKPQDAGTGVTTRDPFVWLGPGASSSGREVVPDYAVASLVSALATPGSIVTQQLSGPVFPMSDAVPDVLGRSSFGNSMWKQKTSWLYTSRNPVLSRSATQQPTVAVSQFYDVVVNEEKNRDCLFAYDALDSSADQQQIARSVRGALLAGLAKTCGTLVNILCIAVEFESSTSRNFVLRIEQCYPGSIEVFSISPNSTSPGALFNESSWRQQTAADSYSFGDLYKALHEPLLGPTAAYGGMPSEVCLKVSDVAGKGIVDQSRAAYYPECVPALLFPVSVRGTLVSPAKAAVVKSYKLPDLSLYVDTPDTSVSVSADVSLAATFGFSLLCSPGGGNITIRTLFAENGGAATAQSAVVPAAGANTFVFTAVVEKRQRGSNGVPIRVTLSRRIDLAPGKLVWDQLGERFLSQAGQADSTGVLARMLSLTPQKSPSGRLDNTTEPFTQYEVTLSPVVEGAFLYVPVEASFSSTTVPGLVPDKSLSGLNIARALTVCPLLRDLRTDIALSIKTATAGTCRGTVGIVGFNCSDRAVAARGTYKLHAQAAGTYHANELKTATYSASFDTYFASTGTVDAAIEISPRLKLDFADVGSDLMLTLSDSRALDSIRNVSSEAPLSVDWTSSMASGVELLKGLRATGPVTLCRASRKIADAVGNFTAQPSASGHLPFATASVGVMYHDMFRSPLAMLRDETCSMSLKPGSVTVDSFCVSVSRALGVRNACRLTRLADDKLTIFLSAMRQQQTRPAVLFDTAKLTGVDNHIPVGNGRAGDLMLDTNQSLDADIVVDVSDGAAVSIDQRTMLLMSSNRIAAAADYKVQFGSGVFTFESTEIHVDAKLRGWLDTDGQVRAFFDGNASLATFVTLSAYMECKLKINVAPVDGYALGNRSAIGLEEMCTSGGFADNIADALRNMGFSSYVVNEPTMLWEQFRKAVQSPFGNGILTQLRDPVSFLEGRVYRVVRKALGAVTAANDVSLAMFEASKAIMANKTSSIVVNDRMSLQLVTDVLNTKLAHLLDGKLVVPPVESRTFVWPMRLRHSTSDDLSSVRFPVGPHGNAVLDRFEGCQPRLVFDWTMELNMTWNPVDGVTVTFDREQGRSFAGSARVDMGHTRRRGQRFLSGRYVNMPIMLDDPELGASVGIQVSLSDTGNRPTVALTADDAFIRSDRVTTGHVGDYALTTEDSFPALPKIQGRFSLGWGRHATGPSRKRGEAFATTPSFQMDNTKYCAAHALSTSARKVVEKANKFLDPLATTFGPDGWLMRPIDGLDKLGDVSVLTFIEYGCQITGKCSAKAIKLLATVIKEVYAIRDVLNRWSTDPEAQKCNTLSSDHGNITVDWTSAAPVPVVKEGSVPADHRRKTVYEGVKLHWQSDKPREVDVELDKHLQKWVKIGDSPFEMNPLSTMNIIDVIRGENIKIFALTLCKEPIVMEQSYTRDWPLLEVPVLFATITVSFSLSISPPPIVFTTGALAAAVQSKGIGQFFRSLAIETLDEEGEKRWIIEATLYASAGIWGGLDLVFLNYKCEYDIFVNAEFKLRIAAEKKPDGKEDEMTTFDSIAVRWRQGGIQNVLQLEFELDVGFKVHAQSCIGIDPFKMCIKFYEFTASVPVLELTWGGGEGLSVSSCSRVNLDLALLTIEVPDEPDAEKPTADTAKKQKRGGRSGHKRALLPRDGPASHPARYTVTEDTRKGCSVVSILPRGTVGAEGPQVTSELRRSSADSPITFGGGKCVATDIVVAGSLSSRLVLPGCQSFTVAIEQEHYASAGVIRIGKDHFSPQGHNAVEFGGEMESLELSRPAMLQTYEVTGLPKASKGVTLATAGESIVQLSGSPADFGGSRLSITGEAVSVEARLGVSQLRVDGTRITGSNGIDIDIPQNLPSLTVEAADNTRESHVSLGSISKGRQVTAVGGTAGSNFRVEAAETIEGEAFVVGYPNASNQLELHAQMTAETALVVSRQSLLLQNGPTNTIVYWTGINYRSFAFKGHAGATTHIMVVRPESFSVTRIAYEGVPGSGAVVPVTSCDAKSEVVVARSGSGNVNAQAVLWSAVYVALRLVSCAFGIAFVASAWRRQGGSSLVPLWALWVWTPFLCVIPVIMTKLGHKGSGQ